MKVRITVIRKVSHSDLSLLYENPLETPCCVQEGQVFLSEDGKRPEGFCESAWESICLFVEELSCGGGNFYNGWMKNPHSAMISCNDGFRPVSFLLETVDV